jgi:hypothetical protein
MRHVILELVSKLHAVRVARAETARREADSIALTIDSREYAMIGLDRYMQNLNPNWKKTFNFYPDFQQWMQGNGFARQTGGLEVNTSSIWRAFRKHVHGKDGTWMIVVIGPPGGAPPQVTSLKAIVVEVRSDDGALDTKPLHGAAWLSRRIIAARHHRLMASLANTRWDPVGDWRKFRKAEREAQEALAALDDL